MREAGALPELVGSAVLDSGPPPCQEPDCPNEAAADTNYTYCLWHAALRGWA